MENKNVIKKQMMLYFTFAALMILLNYFIQKSNQLVFAPYICSNLEENNFFRNLYCSTSVFNMPELVGSVVAVGITYITKFFLDKFIVFKSSESSVKDTSKEFVKYFGFAVLTTIENIGIQFIMTNFFKTPLEVSFVFALSVGYLTKFFLDKRYVFILNKKI